jgi:uncharacterized phiE125 gp8 family phage protein
MRKTTLVSVIEQPVTVAEAVQRLRLDSPDAAEQTDIAAMLAAASDMCAGATGRSVAKTQWSLYLSLGFPDWSGCHITLSWPDAVSIQSITYKDAAGAAQTLDPGQYKLVGGELVATTGDWPADATDVTILYTAGWGLTTPQGLKQWLLLQVGNWYRNRESAVDRQMMVTPFTDRLLDPYRILKV